MQEIYYLGGPYSHLDSKIREERFQKLNICAGKLMNEGKIIYSPISANHPISCILNLPTDWVYWEANCKAFLKCCSKIFILKLKGWRESVGVQAEIKIARDLGLPVIYLEESFIE